VDRRRLQSRVNPREALERALRSWERLNQAWTSILSAAHAVQNAERMALAESKLEECKTEIVRLETLLGAK
jgi:type VI protein secretion system component VasF